MRKLVGCVTGAAAAVGAGCGSDLPDETELPAIVTAEYVQNPNNHLSGTIEVSTDLPARVRIAVTGEGHDIGALPADTGTGTDHEIPVLGLRADQGYEMTVSAQTAEGAVGDERTLDVTTGPLPENFPPIEVAVPLPEQVSPGVTLFGVFRWNPGKDDDWGLLLGVDEAGRVVWYHEHDHSIEDVTRLPSGEIAFTEDPNGFTVINMMGEVTHEIRADAIGLDSVHHEVAPTPDDTLLVLSTEMQTIDGYPDGNGGTESYDVVGDVAVELEMDGTIVDEWSLFDVLDPLRQRPGFHSGFWDDTYPEAADGTKDWTHGNAVVYDDRDDSLIMSLRHQDWIVKIDRASGDLVWALGEDGDFTLEGDGEWQFHQHAPEIQENGNLLIYDNGNARSTLGEDETPYTRTVEYALDTDNDTVTQVWEYRNPADLYAPFVGDADRLANGNVLITDGGLVDDPALGIADPENLKYARIVEVTHDENPEIVFELTLRDFSAGETSYTVYRADRVAGLYPQGQ